MARLSGATSPASVWTYRLGGYQVLKKWLSYREHEILGRALKSEEAQYFSEMARRIAALMQATHDKAHYL